MKSRLHFLIASLLLLSITSSFAAGYNFKIKLAGEANKQVLLGYYHSGSQFVADTFTSDANGLIEFKGDEDLDGGLYLLAIDGALVMDFVYSGKEHGFSIETDPSDPYRKAKVKGSKDNDLFFSLNVNRVDNLTDIRAIDKKIEASKDKEEKKKLREEKGQKGDAMIKFQTEMADNNPGTFTSSFINVYREVEIPEITDEIVNGKQDFDSLLWQFQYSVDHYWDFVDFSDERIIRTPMFKQKVMRYFSPRYCYQHHDSITNQAYKVIDPACEGGHEMFKNVLTWVFGRYQESKILGYDCIMVGLADRYYLNSVEDKCHGDWLTKKQIKKLKDYVDALRYTCMDMKAPFVVGTDMEGKQRSLYDIDAEYTLVYVWSANCGHCKKVTPKFLDVYHDFKTKGFEVYAINNDREDIKNEDGDIIDFKEEKDYHEFVNKNKLDWINVTDVYNRSQYRKFYGINSTPKAFLLDKDKNIVAPRLDHITLRKLLMNRLDGMKSDDIDKFLKENGYLEDIEPEEKKDILGDEGEDG